MNFLYERLLMIKCNPIIYLGNPSLKLLRVYIDGYLARQCEIDENYDFSFLHGFQKYVEKTYKVGSALGWDHIIDSHSSSEESAFDKFYKLLEIFLKKKQNEKVKKTNMITFTISKEKPIKERHFTDHGNSKRFTNPHDHYFKWLPNNVYLLENAINYHDTVPKFTIE